MSRVVVVGGGAAGMMAAASAAANGNSVTIYEKNEKLGKKLYITGKGRCNLTNNCSVDELLQSVCVNGKFLYSAFNGFDSQDTIRFFEEQGMPTKTERGGRVFPLSDHASDVTAALCRLLNKGRVGIHLNEEVLEVITDSGINGATSAIGIRTKKSKFIPADHVIIATGGLSYPSTGSTGDGYRFAKDVGHSVSSLYPSLVPIETADNWAQKLQGLSLKNVEISIFDGARELYRDFGELMFTHYGVTGPLILTASSRIQEQLSAHPLQLFIDLKPALSKEMLDSRILREFEAAKNRQFKTVLGSLFPSKLIPVISERLSIPLEKKVHDITREERQSLIEITKHFPLTLVHLRDFNEAVITRGGVNVKEINPVNMESKKVKGLYFVGEVLDVDAVTGGYNLQIAWSTGYACGNAIKEGFNEF